MDGHDKVIHPLLSHELRREQARFGSALGRSKAFNQKIADKVRQLCDTEERIYNGHTQSKDN